MNIQGSFECSCNTSYILTADNKTCAPNVTECDYMIEEPSGRINTSGFPNTLYAPNSNCTWIIDLPAYKRIELKFDEMNIEESPNCVKDRVTILNGKDADALPLGSYCGNKLPPTIQSSTEVVTIQFVSDGTVNNKGFNLQYRGLKDRSRGKHMQYSIANYYSIAHVQVNMDVLLYQMQILNLVYLLFHQNTMAESIVYTTFFHAGED